PAAENLRLLDHLPVRPVPLPADRSLHSVDHRMKKPGDAGLFHDHPQSFQAASMFCSFFMPLLSIWRMRSAETPYSSASSCSVALGSTSQRRSRMSRLRASSVRSAAARRSSPLLSQSSASMRAAGSAFG